MSAVVTMSRRRSVLTLRFMLAFLVLTSTRIQAFSFSASFVAPSSSSSSLTETRCLRGDDGDDDKDSTNSNVRSTRDRRSVLRTAAMAAVLGTTSGAFGGDNPAFAAENEAQTSTETSVGKDQQTLFVTKSGLKYVDVKVGDGPPIRYGQLVSISYKAFIKLPAKSDETKTEPERFDADDAYLLKHGNGRQVPGLDEGLHTMRIGGVRRIVCPPKLGYVESGLGPLPVSPLNRMKLNRLLDGMVERRGGQVIFEVELRSAIDDEADQGYYEDSSLAPEDFERLRNNLQRSSSNALRGGAGDPA